MIRDLQKNAEPVLRLRAGVVIIGAGIAGLLLAARLQQRGINAVVLESGGEKGEAKETAPLNIVEQIGQPYRGATEGRSRGIGGTSRLWGGAMLPFLPCDMEAHTAGWPVGWPVNYSDVEPYFADVEHMFGLPAGGYEIQGSEFVADEGFLLRSAKWPSMRLRNVATLLRHEIHDRGMEIWHNATVTAFELNSNGRISSVFARSFNGNRLEVHSDLVVMTAGAIESTRLLLLLDAQNDNRVFAPDLQLGHTFFDHISTSAATIIPVNLNRLNHAFGITFAHDGMRDLRIEPSPQLRRKHRLPAAFAHLAAIGQEGSGYASLRDLVRSVQTRSGISLPGLLNLGSDLPWLAQAGWWRFKHRRLLFPRDAAINLALVMEQCPDPRNKIELSREERDIFGIPRARINWRTSESDFEAFRALQNLLCAHWRRNFGEFGSISPTSPDQWQFRLQHDGDIFHPGGTTKMGHSASTGVVDADLRTFRIPNLTVVSTSCFPSGGGANPTFMLMAFALRAADRIAAEMRACSMTATAAANASYGTSS